MRMDSEVLVADLLYKITPKTSLRMELQHVWSDSKDNQRWAMGLLELGLAPAWMVYVSDMCNYESYGDSLHYYRVGGSYSWGCLRSIMAGIGREYNVPGEYAAIFRNIQELLSCYPLLFKNG